jgi:hypothetical protein
MLAEMKKTICCVSIKPALLQVFSPSISLIFSYFNPVFRSFLLQVSAMDSSKRISKNNFFQDITICPLQMIIATNKKMEQMKYKYG